jgi:hypothetical protein
MPATPEEKRRATDDVIRSAAIGKMLSDVHISEPPVERAVKGLRRTLRTADAARYLGLSASLLRKYRAMGPNDPGVHGPDYIKVSANIVLYEISALDDWLDARRSAAAR